MCKLTFGIITLLGSLILFRAISKSEAQTSNNEKVEGDARIIPGINDAFRRWYCSTFCNYPRFFFNKCARKCPPAPIIISVSPGNTSPFFTRTTATGAAVKNATKTIATAAKKATKTMDTATTISMNDNMNLMGSSNSEMLGNNDSMPKG